MAVNFRRMGKAQRAIAVVALGIAVTAAGSLLGYFVPAFATSVVAVTLALTTKGVAQLWQGKAVAQHVRKGGELSSRWAASGVGIAFLSVFCAIIFLGVWAQGVEKKIIVGSKDQIYYSGSATKQDADSLGEVLRTAGYFQDKGFVVLLAKDKGGTTLSFVLKDGVWDQPQMIVGYQQFGRQLAPSLGGFPIKVDLVNSAHELKRELTIKE